MSSSFGDLLCQYRHSAGLTQRALAEKGLAQLFLHLEARA